MQGHVDMSLYVSLAQKRGRHAPAWISSGAFSAIKGGSAALPDAPPPPPSGMRVLGRATEDASRTCPHLQNESGRIWGVQSFLPAAAPGSGRNGSGRVSDASVPSNSTPQFCRETRPGHVRGRSAAVSPRWERAMWHRKCCQQNGGVFWMSLNMDVASLGAGRFGPLPTYHRTTCGPA
eukprot:gene3143-biopygen3652